MIEVTFKFDSIEKAIATLGSLMKGAAPVPNIENPAKPEGGTAGKQRKPRADAGKPRGSYKDKAGATSQDSIKAEGVKDAGESPAAASASAPETAAPSGVAGSDPTGESNSEPTVQTAAAATQEQAQAALEALFAAKGLPAAQAAMGQFGVSRLRDMKPEDYGPFVAAAQEATK
jgi:hypothetical protein